MIKKNEYLDVKTMDTPELVFDLSIWISEWHSLERHHREIKKDPVYLERKRLLITSMERLRLYYKLYSELPCGESEPQGFKEVKKNE